MRSLRLRLALSTLLVAGVAVGIVAWFAWWAILAAERQAFDSELRSSLLQTGAMVVRRDIQLDRTQQDIAQHLAQGETAAVFLWLGDAEPGSPEQASNVPAAIKLSSLPWPAAEPDPRRPGEHKQPDEEVAVEITPLDPGVLDLSHDHNQDPQKIPERPSGHPGDYPLEHPMDYRVGPGDDRQRFRRPPPVQFANQTVGGTAWRIAFASFRNKQLALGLDMRIIDNKLAPVRHAFMLFVPLALLLSGFASWLLANAALRRIALMNHQIAAIDAGGLHARLNVEEFDREFSQWVESFNEMLERLQRSFAQASRFSAEAAHELKTPLAILQGQLERALAQVEPGSDIQRSLSHILDEVRRLSSISRKLLLLSQADAGKLRLHRVPVDLSQELEQLLEDARMLAPGLNVSGQVASGLIASLDRDLILQVLHNLLSNAIKYNLPQGRLRIEACLASGAVQITFSNSSAGIATAQREHIFERFYRADAAHSRQVDGVGLGLCLAREIARAHRGDLQLLPDLQGEVRFRLVLPQI